MARKITIRRRVELRVQVRQQLRTWYASPPPLSSLPQQSAKAVEVRSQPSPAIADLVKEGFGPLVNEEREYDLFLSYAYEDKEYASALAYSLESLGIKVWFAETEIEVGDSLRQSIDDGLLRSRFGVVILSRAFFGKSWTNYELDGLLTLEMQGRKVVLPVLHPDFTIGELAALSPSMAGKKVLLGSEQGVDTIAATLAELVFR